MARLKASSEGKLRTFQKFKTECCMETYLFCKEERVYKNCDLEEVENESHFLSKCPLYCQQRTILMRTILSYTTSESQEELFIILMKNKETAVIKALGKFIHTAFKKREEHMSLL